MDSSKKDRFVIGIAGGSGSGKTTLAARLVGQCARIGITGQLFSLDNYYQPLDHLGLEARKSFNFDHPDAIDSTLAVRHLAELCAGRPVAQPLYDFKLHTRQPATLPCSPAQLIVVEGIHTLH